MVETLSELETLFALMRSAQVAIVELPGIKVVMHPDQPQPVVQRESDREPARAPVRDVHDDPMLYSDGAVPTFGSV